MKKAKTALFAAMIFSVMVANAETKKTTTTTTTNTSTDDGTVKWWYFQWLPM